MSNSSGSRANMCLKLIKKYVIIIMMSLREFYSNLEVNTRLSTFTAPQKLHIKYLNISIYFLRSHSFYIYDRAVAMQICTNHQPDDVYVSTVASLHHLWWHKKMHIIHGQNRVSYSCHATHTDTPCILCTLIFHRNQHVPIWLWSLCAPHILSIF